MYIRMCRKWDPTVNPKGLLKAPKFYLWFGPGIQKQSFQMGLNSNAGNMHQIIGEFAMLDEYDELITLSTTSKAPSLDMMGIKNDKLDFIEFKKKGAGLSTKERNIRRIIENKNVEYVVKEIDIPTEITVQTKELPPIRTKPVRKEEGK